MKIQKQFHVTEDKRDLESGLISQISWKSLQPYLEHAFRIANNEIIVGITVTEDGIKAKIDRKPDLTEYPVVSYFEFKYG